MPAAVLRYIRSTFGYTMDMRRVIHDDAPDDVLEFFLETQGLAKMEAAARSGVYSHAFLVRKGLIPLDLASAVANVNNLRQLGGSHAALPGSRRMDRGARPGEDGAGARVQREQYAGIVRGVLRSPRFFAGVEIPNPMLRQGRDRHAAGDGREVHERHVLDGRLRFRRRPARPVGVGSDGRP